MRRASSLHACIARLHACIARLHAYMRSKLRYAGDRKHVAADAAAANTGNELGGGDGPSVAAPEEDSVGDRLVITNVSEYENFSLNN